MKEFGGNILQEILMILGSKNFAEGPVLEGTHESLGEKLDDFERAIFTYIINSIESAKDLFERLGSGTASKEDKERFEILKLKLVSTSKFMWHVICDRLELWGTGKVYAINKGISIVIIDTPCETCNERCNGSNDHSLIDELPN